MDLKRVLLFFFTNLISIGFNEAESGDSDTTQHVEVDETTSKMPASFSWFYPKGATETVSDSKRLDLLFENDDEDLDPQSRAVYWIPTSCDSSMERGYTCVGCGESLHCMGGNFALKAICHGFRPFCYNGRCSATRGEKCKLESDQAAQVSQDTPANPADSTQAAANPDQTAVQSNNSTVPEYPVSTNGTSTNVDTLPANITRVLLE